MMPDRSFDPAETEVIGTLLETSARKPDRLAVAFFSQIIDDASAWISQPHHFGHLVECLSRCIVPGPTQITVSSDVLDAVEQRVSAGSKQSDVRKRNLVLQMNRQEMRFEMINADIGNTPAKRKSLG